MQHYTYVFSSDPVSAAVSPADVPFPLSPVIPDIYGSSPPRHRQTC